MKPATIRVAYASALLQLARRQVGEELGISHAHLKISAKEWEAFLDDFQQALDKYSVPAEEQAELQAIVNSTRSDIVVDPALGAGQVA